MGVNRIYTKTGDDGKTSLCNGSRVWKSSQRVEAYGTVDELNSFIGLCATKITHKLVKEHLIEIQKTLLTVGANLAYPITPHQSHIKEDDIHKRIPPVNEEMVRKLEEWIDSYEEELPELKNFILSGTGSEASALLHVARTVCRRAERIVVKLSHEEEVNKYVIKYLNRLSDYLFTAARLINHSEGRPDIKWIPKLNKFFRKEERKKYKE